MPFRARLLLCKRPLHRTPVRSWLVLHNTSHAEITFASAGTRFSRITAVHLTNFNAREILFRGLCRSASEVGATTIAAFRPPSEESGRVNSGSSSWLSPVLAATVMRGEISAEQVLPKIAAQAIPQTTHPWRAKKLPSVSDRDNQL